MLKAKALKGFLKSDFKEDFKIIKRLTKKYIKPLLPILFVAVLLMIVVALTTSAYAFLIRDVLDKVFLAKDNSMLIFLPFVAIIITFIKNAALYFQTILMQLFVNKITNRLQEDIYTSILKLDLKKFQSMHTGTLLSMILQSSAAVSNGLNLIFTVLIRELLTVAFLLGVMIYQNAELAALSLIAFPLVFVPIIKIAKRIKRLAASNLSASQGMFVSIDESLKSFRLIKTYGTEGYEIKKIKNVIAERYKLVKKIILTGSLSGPIVECISIIGVALIIWYGGNSVINGTTTPGTFFAFFVSMTMAYKPLKSFSNLNITLQSFLVASRQMFEIMDEKTTLEESPNAKELTKVKGDIEFKNVYFNYNEGVETESYILNNINLKIHSNNKTAFVGPTGAGKSTIISLIMRLYDPIAGEIKLDGKNLKNLKIKSLRDNISYVGQDIQLFDDSILNNLKYAKQHATIYEIEEAIRLANADEFIKKLPEGLETKVGQAGVNLSGGQKQRISIARAILKNSKIVILDEPTSALDAISEGLIKDALEKFTQNKTVIVIAHRLSTIIDSNIIYVVIDGKIDESGTHEELIKTDGHYSKLYKTQFAIK